MARLRGHPNSNIANHTIKPNGIFETNEYKSAMFAGLKIGLVGNAELHDLGEFYSYSTDQHFQDSYQWRKYYIASEEFNQGLDSSYRWVIPENERNSWSNEVGVGFMISNYDQSSFDRGGYNTSGKCTPLDVESRFNKAFNATDDYVVFYSDSSLSSCDLDNRWMDVSISVTPAWQNMLQRVFNSIKAPVAPDDTRFLVIPMESGKSIVVPM